MLNPSRVSGFFGIALLPDPHHLEILRRGPRAWNAWREQNPSILPLLMDATLTLSQRQLGRINGGPVNLKSAHLPDAFLRFAALSEADLEAADLSRADLVHARLDRANLTAANLSNANLDHANFAGAKLSRANLSGASLNHAQNLTQAQISESLGDKSTILPSHLSAPEVWLKARDAYHTSSLTSNRSPADSAAAGTEVRVALSSTVEPCAVEISSASADGSAASGTCGSGTGKAMSDAHQLEILRRGPQAWNAWREENPSTLPLLMEVTLTLSERQLGPINGGPINLASACLRDAFLRFAALSEADLEAADLSQADLVHARLDRANLTGANLSNAILDHADFAGAQLSRVNLLGASLRHARNLTQEQISDSIGNDLTILPSHLKAPESWLQTNELRRSPLGPAYLGDLASKGFNSVVSSIRMSVSATAWKAGLAVCGAALVISGLIWLPTFSLDPRASGEKLQTGGLKPTQSAPSEEKHQASRPTAPAVATAESTSEGRARGITAEPTPAPRADDQTASGSSEPSAETARSIEQTQSALEKESPQGEYGSASGIAAAPDAPVLPGAEPPVQPLAAGPPTNPLVSGSRHDTVSNLPANGSMTAPQVSPTAELSAGPPVVNPAAESAALVVGAAPNAIAPELRAQAFPGELSPTALAANRHAESTAPAGNALRPDFPIASSIPLGLPDGGLVVNTPTSTHSPSNDTSHSGAAPAALPSSAAATNLAHIEETPPMPVRKPVLQKGKPVLQKGEPDLRTAHRGRVKAPTFADKGRIADQKPDRVTGSGSTADVLAGGL